MPSRRDVIRMSDAEVADFLEQGRTLQLATINKDGSPHLVAMWYGLLDGMIVFETFSKSQKCVNMRRDPRVCCLVEAGTGYGELRGVQVNGRVDLSDDPGEVRRLMRLVVGRNHPGMDEKALDAAVEQGSRKRSAAIVRPTKIASWDHRKLDVAY